MHKDRPGWKPDGLWSDGPLGTGIASGEEPVNRQADPAPHHARIVWTDSTPNRRADDL